jgi:voltage-gated potassium channel
MPSTRPPSPAANGALTPTEEASERLAQRLDVPMTVAGLVFLLVVVADAATEPGTPLSTFWSVLFWVLWASFVFEFVLRMVIAKSSWRFLRRNWWQIAFLAVPFLRFLRVMSRSARFFRIASSSVRTSRTAANKLGHRLVWVGTMTVVVTLTGANLLYELGEVEPFADALHAATIATVAGEQVEGAEGWGRVVEFVMLLWSTVGFAALAGSAGAYFLERHSERGDTPAVSGPDPSP